MMIPEIPGVLVGENKRKTKNRYSVSFRNNNKQEYIK